MSKKKTQPISVGEALDKELAGKNRTDFARRIGISRRQLYNILSNTRKLKPKVAENLAEATGKSAKFWLTVQHEHELHSIGAL